ncbi:MAG: hypothetical protein IKO05_03180 [Selenomonadaceae bacterium]|nr:hypothetical protein [Selenomonadaceae bacterium]
MRGQKIFPVEKLGGIFYSTKWNCNNLNSMFGNRSFLLPVYAAALALPDVHFLLLAAMIFSLPELVMHLILFNVKQRTIYNPGWSRA